MSAASASSSELAGIAQVMRTHIEIRNRSWMKRVHRDSFLGSDAVDFLVTQGFADTRNQAVLLGTRLIQEGLIRNITGKKKKFKDAYFYYRFTDDDEATSILAPTNAGNGSGTFLGQGGCKFSFCPHTAHNSYILDIALAEEIERAVAGASIESRSRAFAKLRARVREQAQPEAPDWDLVKSTEVNRVNINVYQRKRPRGDFKNVKMTGVAAETPKGFINGIMTFERRKQWESMFEDGVTVEAIDIGEKAAPFWLEEETIVPTATTTTNVSVATTVETNDSYNTPNLPAGKKPENLARKTDDVLTCLQTVDLAGIPAGMPIGFLNDPERQHALAHLRKQMMLSNPQECMICSQPFESSADIRFCPCCAMVSCGGCVSKRVFEVVSRQVVSVCIHCYRGSSRIRHPPQAVQDTTGIDASVLGKWWRPEELGIIDYSQSFMGNGSFLDSVGFGLVDDDKKPIVPGITPEQLDLDGISVSVATASMSIDPSSRLSKRKSGKLTSGGTGVNDSDDEEDYDDDGTDGDGIGLGVNEADYVKRVNNTASVITSPIRTGLGITVPIDISGNGSTLSPTSASRYPVTPGSATGDKGKTARCKSCGMIISRDVELIEEHMAECSGRNVSVVTGRQSLVFDGHSLATALSSRPLSGVLRRPELERASTRIIYRTARPHSNVYAPREVCCLQDAFMDPDGTCYVYEVSIRHCDVRGMPGYVTADVLLLMHVARPTKSRNSCNITIISQVDTRVQGPQWLLSFIADEGTDIGLLRRDDLVRELKNCGDLKNILDNDSDDNGDNIDGVKISLEDFDLLAVLGRGGFGKVMQVRHRMTNEVYAMKILKKSELRRRRQIERTHTERTILAAIRHPFIVCLHYAFQNSQKLYMVMDFVQVCVCLCEILIWICTNVC